MRRALAAVAVVVTLCACGSTVRQTSAVLGSASGVGGSGLGQVSGDGTSVAGDGSTGGSVQGTGDATATGVGSTGDGSTGVGSTGVGPGGTSSTLPGSAVHSSAATAPASRSKGPASPTTKGKTTATSTAAKLPPGVTATTISVGFFYFPGDGGASQLGIDIDSGDPAANQKAAAAYINKHGGIGGRKLVVESFEAPNDTSSSFAQQYQNICEHFTTDVKVFAVIPASNPTMRTCLAKAGVLAVDNTIALLGDADFAGDPGYFDSSGASLDLAYRNLVSALSRTDYFSATWNAATGTAGGVSPVKVGIIHSDLASVQSAVMKSLLPALSAKGVKVDPQDDVEFHQNTDANSVGDKITSIQSAVVKLRSDNVTHVIAVEADGLAFFATGANSQGYHPRLGVSTAATPQASIDSNAAPATSFAGAVGLGWLPSLDLHDTSAYTPPGKAACLAALQEVGQTYVANSLAESVALATCDTFFLLKKAIELVPAGTALSPTETVSGLERVGSGFSFAVLPGGTFGTGKHYPTSTGHVMSFNGSEFVYTGSPFALQ